MKREEVLVQEEEQEDPYFGREGNIWRGTCTEDLLRRARIPAAGKVYETSKSEERIRRVVSRSERVRKRRAKTGQSSFGILITFMSFSDFDLFSSLARKWDRAETAKSWIKD